VGAGHEVSDTFSGSGGAYDYAVYGPNGFFRAFAGGLVTGSANLSVKTIYDSRSEGVGLVIRNHTSDAEKVTITDGYTGKATTHHVQAGEAFTHFFELHKTFGWYDFTITAGSDATFVRQLAGHVETGKDSVTDPAIGGAGLVAADDRREEVEVA
jgi:phospholipase C